jgi:hypothetical protein
MDTALFVYAVVRADRDLPSDLSGLDGSAVALVPHGDIGAVVSELPVDRPAARRADLTAYSDVMEALVPGGTVAPIRFGCLVPDDGAVVSELLAPREGELTALLEWLDGRVQYNVRASYVEDAVLAEIVQGDPEIQHLRERTRGLPEDVGIDARIRLGELVSQAWSHVARDDADRLLATLVPMVTAHTVRREPGPQAAVDAALLVETKRAQELEDALEDLAEQASGRMQLRLVGPLAPYDFVGAA